MPEEEESSSGKKPRGILAIGASAGGLAAVKTLLESFPSDTGLAIVVVVHLSPDHESQLAELLQPHVDMPVRQVTQNVRLEANRVYVIPPNRNLDAIDTHLRLSPLEQSIRARAAIDHFLRTLAETHDGDAIAILLTGTGSDGTLGMREIRRRGGLTIVQDPDEAEYDGMPRSAIASGTPDLVLPLAEMAPAITRHLATQPRLKLPPPGVEPEARGDDSYFLEKVFTHIRARTGRDFSQYKRSSLLRRIQRRMQFNHVEDPLKYLDLLRKEPNEVQALADELLVVVTSFFRDPEVFELLAKDIIPRLFEGKGRGDRIRVWSVGCATGEEAYSLAMLLLEAASRHDPGVTLQVFASDLQSHSLERARAGFYPGEIETDVGPERLRRFFDQDAGGYRIKSQVRDIVTFTSHNLLGDPPFSRLHLIACRNLLIYLQRDLQQQVVELFHYALDPDGYLLLGSSETIDSPDLFRVEDKKRCIHVKRNVPGPDPRLPVFPVTSQGPTPDQSRQGPHQQPIAYGPIHCRLMEHYAPPSVLVGSGDKVVHFSSGAGRYLVQPSGVPTTQLFKLVRDELRHELRTALALARERREVVSTRALPVRLDDQLSSVKLHVHPANSHPDEGLLLVLFETLEQAGEPPDASEQAPRETPSDAERERTRALEAAQAEMQDRLQSVIEEHETAQEELKASNEELQSANEELRSTLEELETSKEELQSMNEELHTVNQENRHKVDELALLSTDLQNLLVATDIATLFLDRDMRIVRFTPRVAELFNIRGIDRGRPLADLTHRLGDAALEQDAAQVLERLTPVEREVQDDHGNSFLTRMLPYRGTEDRIVGVVITFVDITDRKRIEDALRRSEEFHRRAVEAGQVGTWSLLPDSWDLSVSPQMARMLGLEALAAPQGEHHRRRVVPRHRWEQSVHSEDLPALRSAILASLEGGKPLEHEFRIQLPGGKTRWLYCNGATSAEPDGESCLRGATLDVSRHNEAELVLRESEEQLTAELGAMTVLHELVAELLVCPDQESALHQVLVSALKITAADKGCVQLRDRDTGQWHIVAQAHCGDALRQLELEEAKGESSPGGQAVQRRERVVVADVRDANEYEGLLEAAEAASFRALQVTPLLSRDGELLGLFSTYCVEPHQPSELELHMLDLFARQAVDFIERKRDEKAVRQSEALFRAMFEASGVAALMCDADTGRVERANWAFAQLLERNLGSLSGCSLFDLVDTEDREHQRAEFGKLLDASTETVRGEARLLREKGDELWVYLSASLVPEVSPPCAIVMLFDVSQQKRMEARLSEESRGKDDYLAMLSHELRSPLSAMRHAVELATLVEVNDPALQRACDVLDRQSSHMIRMVDELLDVSRIGRGKVQMLARPTDVRKVLAQVLEDRRAGIEECGLELRAELGEQPVWVEGDSMRLSQVFNNLLGNAAKFTQPKGVVHVSLFEEGAQAVVRVRDTGKGIAPGQLLKIFDTFQQEGGGAASSGGGLGLGLAVAKGLTDLHAGTIEARSEGPGKGSEFEVRLPTIAPPEGEPMEDAAESEASHTAKAED